MVNLEDVAAKIVASMAAKGRVPDGTKPEALAEFYWQLVDSLTRRQPSQRPAATPRPAARI